MKIHEYQAKELFRRFDVSVPAGRVCLSADEIDAAVAAIAALGGGRMAVKAQIHAGGRGKGGGVKIAENAEQAAAMAREILGMRLVTAQTGAAGQVVRRLLIEEGVGVAKELYMGVVVDRAAQQVAFMASSEGGVNIEEVAEKTPEKIRKMRVSPGAEVDEAAARRVAAEIGLAAELHGEMAELMRKTHRLFVETDASLAEINPLIVTTEGRLLALDAKIAFDDNADFRHPERAALRDVDEDEPMEAEAAKHDLSYVALDGDIGCMVNGAGLAMATMDVIKLFGGEPANFLDVGGGATTEKVTAAFKIMLKNGKIRAILVNIFGGIMRCDVIAEGVVAAAREVGLPAPLIVRLEGTNVEQGREILSASGLSVIAAETMADAAEKAVRAAAAGGAA